jgi:hypothetical protein
MGNAYDYYVPCFYAYVSPLSLAIPPELPLPEARNFTHMPPQVGSAQSFMMVLLGDLFDAIGGGPGSGADLTDQTDQIAIQIAILGAGNFVGAYLGSVGFKSSGLR